MRRNAFLCALMAFLMILTVACENGRTSDGLVPEIRISISEGIEKDVIGPDTSLTVDGATGITDYKVTMYYEDDKEPAVETSGYVSASSSYVVRDILTGHYTVNIEGYIAKTDNSYVKIAEEDFSAYFSPSSPSASFVISKFSDTPVGDVKADIIYPKDRINELQYDEEMRSWIFPKNAPSNNGDVITVLNEALNREFGGCAIRHNNPEILHEKDNIVTIKHQLDITTIAYTYIVQVETEIYKEKCPAVIVGMTLTHIDQRENEKKDLERLSLVLCDKLIETHDSLKKKNNEIIDRNNLLMNFSEYVRSTRMHIRELTDTLRMIQREVPNLPEPMRVYNRRLHDSLKGLNRAHTLINDKIREFNVNHRDGQ